VPTNVRFSRALRLLCLVGLTACVNWNDLKDKFADSGVVLCGPDTCQGCCASGVCVLQPTADSCGANGAACQACPSGDECSQGVCSSCNFETCPSGCCVGAECTTSSFSSCGADAGACTTCNPTNADACNLQGQCRCGGGPACGTGQRCLGGFCICDSTSCPAGCCDGTECIAQFPRCGVGGQACSTCDMKADRCSASGCVCGTTGGPCASGQRCAAGACICDPTSCPVGCCTAAQTCYAGAGSLSNNSFCGKNGGQCGSCANDATDCVNGVCTCGGNPSCASNPVNTRCCSGSCQPEGPCD